MGEGNDTPLQYSCLENPMDGGAWCTAVHGVAKSWERLSDFTSTFHSCIGEGNGNPLQCSCLENPRDGGAWWAAVSGVAQSPTRLKRLSSSSSSRDLMKKTPVLNECPRVGPGKRIQKRGQTVKEANLDILVLLTPVFFLIPWKASTPCNLTKMQIKTMRYCLTLVKNDLCQNVYKQ